MHSCVSPAGTHRNPRQLGTTASLPKLSHSALQDPSTIHTSSPCKKKSYCNTTMFMHLLILSGCFHAAVAELSEWDRYGMVHTPRNVYYLVFTVKNCQPLNYILSSRCVSGCNVSPANLVLNKLRGWCFLMGDEQINRQQRTL